MHTTDVLLSSPEAAKVAKVHRSTITRWVQSGRLTPAVRTPGGVLLFTRDALDDAIAAGGEPA